MRKSISAIATLVFSASLWSGCSTATDLEEQSDIIKGDTKLETRMILDDPGSGSGSGSGSGDDGLYSGGSFACKQYALTPALFLQYVQPFVGSLIVSAGDVKKISGAALTNFPIPGASNWNAMADHFNARTKENVYNSITGQWQKRLITARTNTAPVVACPTPEAPYGRKYYQYSFKSMDNSASEMKNLIEQIPWRDVSAQSSVEMIGKGLDGNSTFYAWVDPYTFMTLDADSQRVSLAYAVEIDDVLSLDSKILSGSSFTYTTLLAGTFCTKSESVWSDSWVGGGVERQGNNGRCK
jgi:hypothetical protein